MRRGIRYACPRASAATLAVFFAAVLVGGCAPTVTTVPPAPPSERVLRPRIIRGRVSLPGNNVPAKAVEVRGGGQVILSDGEGNYALDALPAGKVLIVAEARVQETRYLAVDRVILGEELGETTLDLALADASNVDSYCSTCHPYLKAERKDQIVRDIHTSDIRPEQATKNLDGTMLDERGFVTCESCHTIHQETGIKSFLRYPGRRGVLCLRCHGVR